VIFLGLEAILLLLAVVVFFLVYRYFVRNAKFNQIVEDIVEPPAGGDEDVIVKLEKARSDARLRVEENTRKAKNALRGNIKIRKTRSK
jgi:hypothetical protein